jgi:hypothetical protein
MIVSLALALIILGGACIHLASPNQNGVRGLTTGLRARYQF